MMPDVKRNWPRQKNVNGKEFGFPDVFFNFLFIYFHQLNDELEKHKENIFWQRKF